MAMSSLAYHHSLEQEGLLELGQYSVRRYRCIEVTGYEDRWLHSISCVQKKTHPVVGRKWDACSVKLENLVEYSRKPTPDSGAGPPPANRGGLGCLAHAGSMAIGRRKGQASVSRRWA